MQLLMPVFVLSVLKNVCIYKGFLLVTEEAGSQTGPEFTGPYLIYCLTKLTLTK